MSKEITTISIRAYADLLGINDKTIRNAIASGKIVAGVRYTQKIISGKPVQVPEIIKDAADKEFGFLHQTIKQKPGQTKDNIISKIENNSLDSDDHPNTDPIDINPEEGELQDEEVLNIKIHSGLTYREATRRREIVSLALERRKLQELEGSLIRRDEVERVLFAMGVELKKSLLNVPSRITAEVRSAANEVEAQNILTIEFTQILNQFSNLQELKL